MNSEVSLSIKNEGARGRGVGYLYREKWEIVILKSQKGNITREIW